MSDADPDADRGLIPLEMNSVEDFIEGASAGRVWEREPTLREVA
jgi:catalase